MKTERLDEKNELSIAFLFYYFFKQASKSESNNKMNITLD